MIPKRRGLTPTLRYLGFSASVLIILIGVCSMTAQGVSSIAQGFQTSGPEVVAGALVSLKKDSPTPNTVELSTTENLEQLIGVAGEQSLIELSNGATSVKVVTNGATPAIVTDINGDIKTGDKITVSPIAGVGMKATVSTLIVGTAQGDFSTEKAETRTVTDKSGKQKVVHIGTVPIQVDKVFYEAPADQATFLPPILQDFANHIAGKQVSAVRVLISAMLVIFMFVTVAVLLYSSIRSSIISIGRNPLSEQAVKKSLTQVGLTVAGMLVFTIIIIYVILVV